ncbi:MAG TPA: restriction endonuclease [Candidatus Sulfotelmatobacter sp.]|nr:restriction endonuclease [Candidatus Sulfotelmatobacter sp.]
METPQEKGDALENAVAAIEEVILQSSAGMGRHPLIEKKKIVVFNGVRHEIDICVTADLAPGYRSIFIFECKNWKEAVGKNEIIVFSEKIDASGATSGCFVAKSYTSDAVNQARQDPRITLLLAAEHDPDSGAEAFQFFTRSPEMTKLDVTMYKRGSASLDQRPIPLETAELECSGRPVDLRSQLHIWSINVCADDLMAFFEEPVPAGIYHRVVDRDLHFAPGQVSINHQEVEKLAFHVEYQVTVTLVPVLSHFEVKSRGRCITFAPQLVGKDTMQWQVVMPSAK